MVQSSIMVLVCNMAFAKSMIYILAWMCFELLCTNVLVVSIIGKLLFTTYLYFLQRRNKNFCSAAQDIWLYFSFLNIKCKILMFIHQDISLFFRKTHVSLYVFDFQSIHNKIKERVNPTCLSPCEQVYITTCQSTVATRNTTRAPSILLVKFKVRLKKTESIRVCLKT